ncbi:hypothetical protein MGALJ_61220 (plasmid) [Mycobacterium gallinarum]|uniref:DUF305 domain-containing protein n=1 Tax=Mycobacterium gallinarum TaxID=39689 RepID=A0A9W4BGA6_9MYCO|nr:DUF305 domain-containing protein [Mycobacterium gallinarum]BBY96453.1 hypothetical protein MGALJ_61220 [Mycobacterium gallinarum]
MAYEERGHGTLCRCLREPADVLRTLELTTRIRGPFRVISVAFGLLITIAVAGCGKTEGVSAQRPSNTSVVTAEEAHTRFDVLFARDIIDHNAQAIALSNLAIVKDGLAPEIVDIASRITDSSSRRTDELQALLLDWGFAPMSADSAPPTGAPNLPVRPGEHPLATEIDFRRLTDAAQARAADVYLELMIKQHQFTISAARDELQSGSHPDAMAIARSLVESQQAETSVMEALQR